MQDKDEMSYDFIKRQGTGSLCNDDYVFKTVGFDKYRIKVKLSTDGKFLGVVEVMVARTFVDANKSATLSKVHDVDEFYEE